MGREGLFDLSNRVYVYSCIPERDIRELHLWFISVISICHLHLSFRICHPCLSHASVINLCHFYVSFASVISSVISSMSSISVTCICGSSLSVLSVICICHFVSVIAYLSCLSVAYLSALSVICNCHPYVGGGWKEYLKKNLTTLTPKGWGKTRFFKIEAARRATSRKRDNVKVNVNKVKDKVNDIYSIHSHYKGNHRKGAAAVGRHQ